MIVMVGGGWCDGTACGRKGITDEPSEEVV